MTGKPRGKKWLEDGQLVSVIEQKQPTWVRPEPLFHCLHYGLLPLSIVLWQLQELGDLVIRSSQCLDRLRLCPQHCLILLAIAIGVLDRQLRLADPTQTTDCLGLAECYH